jgi:hypothetical protein
MHFFVIAPSARTRIPPALHPGYLAAHRELRQAQRRRPHDHRLRRCRDQLQRKIDAKDFIETEDE